ncbi:hypothetical protein CROQUDRAFT_26415, partial [Cronartium quercuum f. sp. fusiforme G11]
EEAFLAEKIPAPNQPNITTISHVLCPLINQSDVLDCSISIKIHCHPEGQRVIVQLANLHSDMVSNHKVSGFRAHSGTHCQDIC